MSLYTNDTDTLRQMISQAIPQALMALFTIVVTFISMLLLSPLLTILAVVIIFIMLKDAPKVTFTSSNPKVAAVNKTTGKVTAKAKGSAVITAKCGDVKVTCKVTVKNPTLTLNKTSASVKVGKTTKITAKAAPSGKVTYKSGNKKIATVSSNGTIKGIKKGTAKITVTCNGVTKTVKVTVK